MVAGQTKPQSPPDLCAHPDAKGVANPTKDFEPKARRRGRSTSLRNSFQIWQSENADLEQIVLRFSGRAAQLVRERNWHSSQQIQKLADGNLELSLTLNSLEEIVPWILSWGKDCEVGRAPEDPNHKARRNKKSASGYYRV